MALVSQREFAQIAGVSHVAIGKASRSGKLSMDSGKIDTTGPLTIEYLRRRGAIESGVEPAPNSTTKRTRRKTEKHPNTRGMVTDELDDYIDDDGDDRSAALNTPPKGTKAYYDLEFVKQKTFALGFKNMELVGKVFSREVFDRGFWNPLQVMFIQWNSDLPKTIAATIFPLIKSGAGQVEVEGAVRRLLSQSIKACKGKLTRALDSLITLKAKDENIPPVS